MVKRYTPPRKKPTFRVGEIVTLKGDQHSRRWKVIGHPAHGTTILIQRIGRKPTMYSQAFVDPDELARETPTG